MLAYRSTPLGELTPDSLTGFQGPISTVREKKGRKKRGKKRKEKGKEKGDNLPLYVPQPWREIDGYEFRTKSRL